MDKVHTTTEALLRIAGELALVGGWAIDTSTDEVFWSEQINAILEYPPGTVPDLAEAIDCYPEPDRSRLVAALSACRSDGKPFDLEMWANTRLGRRKRVRAVGEAVFDSTGSISNLRGAFQDITERFHAEQETDRLVQRLASTLESISDAMFLVDNDWRFSYMNSRAEEFLQQPRTALIGQDMWEVFAPAVGGAFYEQYHHAVRTGETVVTVDYYPPFDRWFESSAHPTPEGLAVYFRDVTERQRTRQLLLQRQALLDRASDAIIVRSLDHRIEYWNGGAERLYGWTTEEAIGRSARDLLYRDANDFDAAVAGLMEAGEWTGELLHVTRDGDTVSVMARWTLMTDESGTPNSVLTINTDITERKRMEQQFLRAQRLESIGTLAGGIAHDLNNVLTPIMMSVDVLSLNETDARRAEILATIRTSAKRGADMIRQVLSFARGLDGQSIEVRVADVLEDIERIMRETFPRSIDVIIGSPVGDALVVGDPTQLHQVMLNLCLNARDALVGAGTLNVSADLVLIDDQYAALVPDASAGRFVVFVVEDNGTGMDAVTLDRAMEPFFTTKPHGQGTGLGLSTSLAIVRSHGGFVQLYSELGRGTVAKVYLPLADDGRESTIIRSLPEPLRGDNELILVVDDETSVLQITRQTLEAFGYRVLTADNGADAVSCFVAHPDIDVVLTDMMMPIMDGAATIRVLRNLRPDVPIIAASGLNANGALARAMESGVHTFLPKPYSAARLLETLAEVLAADSPRRSS